MRFALGLIIAWSASFSAGYFYGWGAVLIVALVAVGILLGATE